MSVITAERYHDFCAGHRVVGHENKCRHLHGHNYRTTFVCKGELDNVGRVIDFGVIKSTLCQWLEDNWDHKMLLWEEDSAMLSTMDAISGNAGAVVLRSSVVWTPFNPTAENMAEYLLTTVGPEVLEGTGVVLTKVIVEETRKCSATAELGERDE